MSHLGEEHRAPMSERGRITVVGIGADGADGLSAASLRELRSAAVLFGSLRQLELLAAESLTADCRVWPSPLLDALPTLFDGLADVHVLASGDPMLHGIGSTLVRLFGADHVRVLPQVSSVSLACARLGWAVNDVEVISLVTAAPAQAIRHRGRAIVLSRNASTPAELARALTESGMGASRMTVLEQLGGRAERTFGGTADGWVHEPGDSLNVVAVEYLPSTLATDSRQLTSGLPDDAFAHERGQLTKRAIRAITLSTLAPRPGQRLWDVGAGSGSIAIEWVRAGSGCTAVAFEIEESRRRMIAENAAALGVAVEVLGAAPDDFGGAEAPDVVFVGGGAGRPGLIQECWDRLPAGGRIVANAVTAESEASLLQWYSRYGGSMRRYRVEDAAPLGGYTGWRSRLPVTQWDAVKP